MDAVQSSRFITVKKSHELIHKLEQQTSAYGAQTLQRQVFVAGRVKSMNESVYYNIDAIHNAINEKRQIIFRYFDYNIHGRKVLRHDGAVYQMSPYALLCSDENYYLTAYDGTAQEIKHFRVDKMLDIQVTELSRDGEEIYESFDLGRYASIHFGMFKGEERMCCSAAAIAFLTSSSTGSGKRCISRRRTTVTSPPWCRWLSARSSMAGSSAWATA